MRSIQFGRRGIGQAASSDLSALVPSAHRQTMPNRPTSPSTFGLTTMCQGLGSRQDAHCLACERSSAATIIRSNASNSSVVRKIRSHRLPRLST